MLSNKQDFLHTEISRLIQDGTIKDKLPSSEMLARRFEVNIRTVNKAISKLARDGLLEKRPGIGCYVKSTQKQKIRILVKRSHKWSTLGSFHGCVLEGVRKKAHEIGCEIEEKQKIDDLKGFDGVIFLGQFESENQAMMKREKKPFVVIEDHPDPEIASVCADVHPMAHRCIKMLLDKGYTRLAYIGMTTSRVLFTDIRKFHAYLEAIDDTLHTIDFSLVRHVWPSPDYAYEALRSILKSSGPPQIVFITSDFVAPGIFRAVEEFGLLIPNHIQILSCDSLNVNLGMSLASIDVPKSEMGEQSVATLLELIANPGKHRTRKVRLPCKFIPGQSLPALKNIR